MYTQEYFDDLFKLSTVFDNFFENRGTAKTNYPLVNVRDDNDTLTLEAQVPGIKAEDIDVEIIDKTLTISGEKKQSEQEGSYLRRERAFGKFTKTIKLPYRVDTDSVEASMENGILRLTLSKAEDAKLKKIEIH